MKGYVQNVSKTWAHAMKRNVAPLGKISLEELYVQYGEKHDLARGKQFVNWLKSVKLQNRNNWKIELKDEEPKPKVEKSKEEEPAPPKTQTEIDNSPSPVPTKELSVEDVVGLSVRKAREIVPKINDEKLLKYSLQEARPRPGKDSLCQILRKRLLDLQTFRS
jgi:hypothetical protein